MRSVSDSFDANYPGMSIFKDKLIILGKLDSVMKVKDMSTHGLVVEFLVMKIGLTLLLTI